MLIRHPNFIVDGTWKFCLFRISRVRGDYICRPSLTSRLVYRGCECFKEKEKERTVVLYLSLDVVRVPLAERITRHFCMCYYIPVCTKCISTDGERELTNMQC